MSKTKKIVIIAVSVFAVAAVLVGLAFWYRVYHPSIYLTVGLGNRDSEDYHSELIEVVIGGREGVPVAKGIREELSKLQDWNNGVDALLSTYRTNTPYDIRVSGKTEGGKITLRYEGRVTGENGEKRDILEEMTFNIPVREKDFKLPVA